VGPDVGFGEIAIDLPEACFLEPASRLFPFGDPRKKGVPPTRMRGGGVRKKKKKPAKELLAC